jgi:tetratricopeptide (TPR) repeat protein
LTERSIVALRAGDLSTASATASDARAAADRTGDPHLAGLAQRLVGMVARARGEMGPAREALERSVALAADDPDPTALIAALTGLALTLAAAGAADDAVASDNAVASAESAIAACRRIGDRHLEAAVESHLADLLHDAGRPEESMTHLKRAVALFAEVGEGAPEREPGLWPWPPGDSPRA